MHFALNEDQIAVRDMARAFAAEKIAPHALRWDEEKHFPVDVMREAATLGMGGIYINDDVGGSAMTRFDAALIFEALATGCPTVSAFISIHNMASWMIDAYGNDTQRQKWLPKLCAGEALGAFGLTEPDGGSDAGGTRTTAVLDEATNEWVINGSKCFITNSGTDITELVTVTAVTGRKENGAPLISSIIVPSGTPGFTVAAPYSKVGWNASDTRELSFADVRVPAANLLGEAGRGYAQFLRILDEGRIAISALATGLAQGCVDESVKYAQERHAFGRPIGANQSIQFKIADMEMRAHMARIGWRDAASRLVAGEPFKKEAAIAKLYSSTVAVDNARDATQIHGGYGFMNEYPVARMWRDAKILEIGEGTSEVQRMLIARELGMKAA